MFNWGRVIGYPLQYSWAQLVNKESACSAEDLGSMPGLVRSPGEGIGYPLQDSCLENSMGSPSIGYNWATFTEFSNHSTRSGLQQKDTDYKLLHSGIWGTWGCWGCWDRGSVLSEVNKVNHVRCCICELTLLCSSSTMYIPVSDHHLVYPKLTLCYMALRSQEKSIEKINKFIKVDATSPFLLHPS